MFGRSKLYSLEKARNIFEKKPDINSGKFINRNAFHYFSINFSNPHTFSTYVSWDLFNKKIKKESLREYLGKIIKVEFSSHKTSPDILLISQIKKDQSLLNYYSSEVLNHLKKAVSNTIALYLYQINNEKYEEIRKTKDRKLNDMCDKVMLLTLALLQCFNHLTENSDKNISIDIAQAKKVILDSVNNQNFFKKEFERWYMSNNDGSKKFFKDYLKAS